MSYPLTNGTQEILELKNNYIPLLRKYISEGEQGYADYAKNLLKLAKNESVNYSEETNMTISKLIGDIQCCDDDPDPEDLGEISEYELRINAADCLKILEAIVVKEEGH